MKKHIIINSETFTRSKKKLQKILKEKNLSLSLSEVANVLSQTFGFKNEYDLQKNYLSLIEEKKSKHTSLKLINHVNYSNMINQNILFFKEMEKRKGQILISGSTGIGKTTLSEYLSKLIFKYKEKIQIIDIPKYEIENFNNFNFKFMVKSDDLFEKLEKEINGSSNLNFLDTFGTTGKGKTIPLERNIKDKPSLITIEDTIEHDLSHLLLENRLTKESDNIEIIKSSPNSFLNDISHCITNFGFSFIETTSQRKLISKKTNNKKENHILKNLNQLNFYFHISKMEGKIYIYGLDLKNNLVLNYIEFEE